MRLIISLCLLSVSLLAESQSLDEVRKTFHEAVKDPTKSEGFYEYIKVHPGTDPVIMAYKAVSEAMIAQTVWNPISKYAHVKRFGKDIDDIIEVHQDQLEIRFLRFAVEYYLPRILMMSEHLDEDRDFLVSNLASIPHLDIDKDFARYIIYFMNETGMVETEKMEEIKASLAPKAGNQF